VGRLARWTVAVTAAAILAGLSAVALAAAWKDRATDVCENNKPASASDYTVEWETSKFAYICKYKSSRTPDKRVSIVDAFHGEGRRHGPDR
jgi:hypothetical protein